MDFNLTDEQELIVASYRDYMESENWEAYFAECDEKHEYPLRWAQGLCEMGFDRIMLDEEHGGLGLEQPITTLMAICGSSAGAKQIKVELGRSAVSGVPVLEATSTG